MSDPPPPTANQLADALNRITQHLNDSGGPLRITRGSTDAMNVLGVDPHSADALLEALVANKKLSHVLAADGAHHVDTYQLI